MIELSSNPATVAAGVVLVAAAAWASFVSVRSAVLGPRWTIAHLSGVRRVAWLPAAAGVIALLVVRPRWLGLVALYVPLAVLLIAWMMERSLRRLEAIGGLDPVEPEVAMRVLTRARRAMVTGGGVLVGLAGVGLMAGAGPVSWICAAVGATIAGNGVAIRSAVPSFDRGTG